MSKKKAKSTITQSDKTRQVKFQIMNFIHIDNKWQKGSRFRLKISLEATMKYWKMYADKHQNK